MAQFLSRIPDALVRMLVVFVLVIGGVMLLGMLLPLGMIVAIKLFDIKDELRKLLCFITVILIQLGIFATRWNVVIGGQMFSKSFPGLTVDKPEIGGMERLLMTLILLALPFSILGALIKVLPPWDADNTVVAAQTAGP